MINVCKTLRVLMRCVSVIAPAPGCWPHTGHISPAGARLSQKHCKNFSNLKPCKFSSRLSCQPGGGEQWRGNCKILAKCPPSRPRHLYIYLPPPGPQHWLGSERGGRVVSMFCPNLQALMAQPARPSWQSCVDKKPFSLPTLASGELGAG